MAKKSKKTKDVDINIKVNNLEKAIKAGIEHRKKEKWKYNKGCAGATYGLGFIGALVYYISTATGFWNGVWGVIKALLWPAFLIYGLLKYLGL